MTINILLGFVAACFLLSLTATGAVLFWLRRQGVLDQPNQRSSHTRPTPRGGGLAVIPVICFGWLILVILGVAPIKIVGIVLGAAVLAYISWRDDRYGLPVLPRFAAQVLVVVIGTLLLPKPGFVFQGLLPIWIDLTATAFIWLWFVNLYNFMDGIDGITSVETIAIAAGICVVTMLSGASQDGLMLLALAASAAMLGFLPWNWNPARIFLGDIGSIPLGLIMGWLLLAMASRGLWAAALILPLYYLTDATLTLLRRAVTGKKIWQAHREHFYQRALLLGRSHGWVALRILAGNMALVLLAMLSLYWPFIAVALAVLVTGFLLVHLVSGAMPVAPSRAVRS